MKIIFPLIQNSFQAMIILKVYFVGSAKNFVGCFRSRGLSRHADPKFCGSLCWSEISIRDFSFYICKYAFYTNLLGQIIHARWQIIWSIQLKIGLNFWRGLNSSTEVLETFISVYWNVAASSQQYL